MKRNFINFALAAVVAVGAAAYTGCGKKGCMNEADINFDASATESDPEACDPSGTVARFVGTFSGTETCTSGNDAYSITITASANEYFILVANLYNAGSTFVVSASVSQNQLTIANQIVEGVTVSGSGTLNGNALTITYTLSLNGNSDTCTLNATKQ